MLLSLHKNICWLFSTYRRLDNLPWPAAHLIERQAHNKISFLLFDLVAGPERPVYSFLTDAERTDGSESDRAGGLRGYRFLS